MNKKKIIKSINPVALEALCDAFDREKGSYPEHRCEGAAVFAFFESLIREIEEENEVRDRGIK